MEAKIRTAAEKPLLERAFELASSGDYRTVMELEKHLKKEGYASVAAHLGGPSIRKQLRKLFAVRDLGHAPARPA